MMPCYHHPRQPSHPNPAQPSPAQPLQTTRQPRPRTHTSRLLPRRGTVSLDASGEKQGSLIPIQPRLGPRVTKFDDNYAFWSGCPKRSGSWKSARCISLEANFDTTPASQPSRGRGLQTNTSDSRGIRRPRGPAVQPDRASILQAKRSRVTIPIQAEETKETGDPVGPFGEQSSQESDPQAGRPERRRPPGQKEIQPTS